MGKNNRDVLIKKVIELNKKLVDIFSTKISTNQLNREDQSEIDKLYYRAAYDIVNKLLFLFVLEKRENIDLKIRNYDSHKILKMSIGDLFIETLKINNAIENIELKSEELSSYLISLIVDKEKNDEIELEILNSLKETREKIMLLDFEEKDFLNLIGEMHERLMDKKERKKLGLFYTPNFVVDFMTKEIFRGIDIIKDPFIKIIDPACGSGYFLSKIYDYLNKIFIENIDELAVQNREKEYIINGNSVRAIDYWKRENIHCHIIENCIFGSDKDRYAVKIAITNLLLKDPSKMPYRINIICSDSLFRWEKIEIKDISADNNFVYINVKNGLFDEKVKINESIESVKRNLEFWKNSFDIVIGNPPYIGHKQLSMETKEWLLKNYEEVFKDKADISYCFYKRAQEILKENGKLCFISNRYFFESPTGKKLRKNIVSNLEIEMIMDFYGAAVFAGVGVASAIILAKKSEFTTNGIKVYKLKDDNFDFDRELNMEKIIHENHFDIFSVSQDKLTAEGWQLVSFEDNEIIKKIEKIAKHKLSDICISFQGIISGCDKAFVFDTDNSIKNNIEKELLFPFLKNSDINKFSVKNPKKVIIYSNIIENDNDSRFRNALNHISKYREKLETRRECLKGIRLWYHLQWGREIELFQKEKIVFPYKAIENRFAIDREKRLFSADIYSIFVKDEFKNEYSLEYLTTLLNSKFYEKYFKSFGKKMGEGIYDYYPNTVMELRILKDDNYFRIENIGKEVYELGKDYVNNREEIFSKLEEADLIIEESFK